MQSLQRAGLIELDANNVKEVLVGKSRPYSVFIIAGGWRVAADRRLGCTSSGCVQRTCSLMKEPVTLCTAVPLHSAVPSLLGPFLCACCLLSCCCLHGLHLSTALLRRRRCQGPAQLRKAEADPGAARAAHADGVRFLLQLMYSQVDHMLAPTPTKSAVPCVMLLGFMCCC